MSEDLWGPMLAVLALAVVAYVLGQFYEWGEYVRRHRDGE